MIQVATIKQRFTTKLKLKVLIINESGIKSIPIIK